MPYAVTRRLAGFNHAINMIAVRDGQSHEVTRAPTLNGFSWLPDGSGFVYSSSRGSTMLYPPVFNLRTISRSGSDDRQVTFGDDSYIQPDVQADGKLLVARIRMRSDIWKVPVSGSPSDNTRGAVRVTNQTGQVQTPTVSPDGARVAYLSDSGGHSNLCFCRWSALASSPIDIRFFSTSTAGSGGRPPITLRHSRGSSGDSVRHAPFGTSRAS